MRHAGHRTARWGRSSARLTLALLLTSALSVSALTARAQDEKPDLTELLQGIVRGQMPEGGGPVGLFEVDLTDEAAVAARIVELEPIAAREADEAAATGDGEGEGAGPDAIDPAPGSRDPAPGSRDPTPDARGPAPDARGPSPDSRDPVPDAREPEPGDPDSEGGDSDATTDRAEGAGEALAPWPDPTPREAALRLEILRWPRERRVDLVAALERGRALARERAATAAAEARARARALEAEARRRAALEEAAARASLAEQELLAELARVESSNAQLEAAAEALAAEQARTQGLVEESLSLEAAAANARRGEDEASADETYESIVAGLRRGRAHFATVLGRCETPAPLRTHESPLALDAADLSMHGDLLERVRRARNEFRRDARTLQNQERRERFEECQRLADRLRALDAERQSLIPHLSAEGEERFLGYGESGLQQIEREVYQAQLLLRYAWLASRRAAEEFPNTFVRWLGRSETRWALVLSVLGVMILLALRGARGAFAEAVARTLVPDDGGRRERVRRTLILALAEPLATLVALLATIEFAAPLGRPELVVIVLELLAVGAVARALYAGLRVGLELRRRQRRDIERSAILREFARVTVFVLIGAAVLAAVVALTGRGHVYTSTVTILRLWAIALVGAAIYRSRDAIAAGYSERYPDAPLARAVSGETSLFARAAAMPIALVRLALVSAFDTVRDQALRFEAARRAAALFAERRVAPADEVNEHDPLIPAGVRAVFDGSLHEPAAEVGRTFDAMAKSMLARFAGGGRGAGIAIVGERGGGRTTYARALLKSAKLEAVRLSGSEDLYTAADVTAWLGQALGLDVNAESVDALCDAIEPDARKVILVDDAHRLLRRRVGGHQAIRTLIEAVGRTSDRVLWVLTFTQVGYRYLQRARQSQDLFQCVVELKSWDENDVAVLLEKRVDAHQYTVSYEPLCPEGLSGRARRDALTRAKEDYLRLLWSYADGNPSVALRFFLRSIVTARGGNIEIELFDAPDPAVLDALHEHARFVLAALALHDRLGTEDLASVTTYAESDVRAIVHFLESRNVVERDEEGRARVTLHWFRAVMRFLRRQHLLFG